MFRQLFTILLVAFCLFGAQSAAAQTSTVPKRTVSHNQDFLLQRPIALSMPSYQKQVRQELSQFVVENGGVIETNFFRKLFSAPSITLRQANKIAGSRGDNALQIEVSSTKVTLTYTTELALQRGLELIKMQTALRAGATVIVGVDIIDWVDVNYTPHRHRAGDIDLTAGTTLLPRSQIEALIARTKKGDAIEITVVSPRGWVIESSPLEGINPQHKIYSPMGYYTVAHIKGLNDYAASKGVELVLKTNILESNPQFFQTTGFEMNSVEGMRFVRAMFTQWTAGTGITTFVIGKEGTKIDTRYQEFLDFLQKTLNITFTYE